MSKEKDNTDNRDRGRSRYSKHNRIKVLADTSEVRGPSHATEEKEK